MIDYLKYFDRESYLFEDVHSRFHADHSLGAFDFFSIVIWKANRAKSKIARRLLKKDLKEKQELEARCRALTDSLYKAKVSRLVPTGLNLRDKDRYLYGRSNALQLEEDIQRSFNVLDK